MITLAESAGNMCESFSRWEPVRFGRVINCNRPELWAAIENGVPKFFKNGKLVDKVKGKAPLLIGLFAVGAITTLLASNTSKTNKTEYTA